jgi:hypothetical protein
LHPDINHDSTPEQQAQFNDAVNAYKKADLSELKIIYLLLEKTHSNNKETESTMEKLAKRKELLLNEKKYLSEEIQKTKEEFPYNIIDLLQDKTKIQQKIDELSNLSTECQEQYKTIESHLEVILKNGRE